MNYPDDSLFGSAMARHTDPITSHLGASDVRLRRDSQKVQLLIEYAKRPMTDEEAGYASKLAMKPKCCYWKRCSELRDLGFIADMGVTRLSSAGSAMMVCDLTREGRIALQNVLDPTTESEPT